ncbi:MULTISPECIES: hypothetical protein [Microbacterium]|uniref:hypothetical protein n=1 Tax=Microbacterium TaxID=33882 RepID=UPI002785D7E7|nr:MULTISPECIES: hypothetical protein [Microbacterium]MDQ1085180.1 hypothetical protein [Microbacterium sp. SORGH_AS_0344]MDQ1169514.1 hypothetical protein [Microbacterium proteolyticum]
MSQTAPAGVDFPGKTLGIVGLVLAFFFTILGSVVSFIAWRQSRAAGYQNTPALVGIAIGAVSLSFWVVMIILLIPLILAATT